MKKIFSVFMICLLSACASQKTQPTAEVVERSIGADENAADASGLASGGATFHPLEDPNNILSQRSVYYDYDSYTVKNEYRELVLAHASYLRDNPNTSVLLQGNTDERGSREYNLALGQRRADNVKNMMTLAGARDAQIDSVSLGEEKPRVMSHDEAALAENRRTDILYHGE